MHVGRKGAEAEEGAARRTKDEGEKERASEVPCAAVGRRNDEESGVGEKKGGTTIGQ